jgi:hypothetical protein
VLNIALTVADARLLGLVCGTLNDDEEFSLQGAMMSPCPCLQFRDRRRRGILD